MAILQIRRLYLDTTGNLVKTRSQPPGSHDPVGAESRYPALTPMTLIAKVLEDANNDLGPPRSCTNVWIRST
jgi:hypothetical protein